MRGCVAWTAVESDDWYGFWNAAQGLVNHCTA